MCRYFVLCHLVKSLYKLLAGSLRCGCTVTLATQAGSREALMCNSIRVDLDAREVRCGNTNHFSAVTCAKLWVVRVQCAA